jgi:hypothetical protein
MSIQVVLAYKSAREHMVQALGYDARRVAEAAATLVAHQHALVPGGIEGVPLVVGGRDAAFAEVVLDVDAAPAARVTAPPVEVPAPGGARGIPRLRAPDAQAAGPCGRWTAEERAALASQVAWYAVYLDGLHACAVHASLRRAAGHRGYP